MFGDRNFVLVMLAHMMRGVMKAWYNVKEMTMVCTVLYSRQEMKRWRGYKSGR